MKRLNINRDFNNELTNAFINDVDGKEFKVEKYFMD